MPTVPEKPEVIAELAMQRLSSLEEQVAADRVAVATALNALLHEQRQELTKQQATVAFLEQKNAFLEQKVEQMAARISHFEARVTLVGSTLSTHEPLRPRVRRSNSEGAFARACSMVTSVLPVRR